MGKGTNLLIDAVNQKLKDMGALEQSIGVLWGQMEAEAIGGGQFGNSISKQGQILVAPELLKKSKEMTKKIDELKPKILAARDAAKSRLDALEKHVDEKEKKSKLPWKPASIKKVREFIAKTTVLLAGTEKRVAREKASQKELTERLKDLALSAIALKKELESESD